RIQRFLLVRAQRVRGERGQVDLELTLGPGDVPVDRRLGEVLERDPLDRDRLPIQGVFGMWSPLVGGGDDDAVGEWGLARSSEERVQIALLQVVLRFVELALDRRVLAGVTLPR